jgi:hypothetical protein
VVGGALDSSCLTINANAMQAVRQRGTQEDVVETKTAIAFRTLSHVIPKREHRLFGVERANGIGPALRDKVLIRGAALRL